MAKKAPPLKPQGWLTGRDAVWAAIRELGQNGVAFTAAELLRRANVSVSVVQDYLPQLCVGGFLVAEKANERFCPNRYRLVRDWGVDTPRFDGAGALVTAPTARERMWQAMKVLPSFNPAELAAMAQADLIDTKSYIADLKRAQYLTVVSEGKAGVMARYALPSWRNTGARPPAIRRDKSVFDLNLGRQVWPEVAA